jgi:DNA polymerase III delta subunit
MGKVPVFAVSGSDDFHRLRNLLRLITDHQENGWKIDRINGTLASDLRAALSQNSVSFMAAGPILVVVDSPEKADLGILEAHSKKKSSDTVILLHYEGDPKENTKFGKFLKGLGKQHRNYPSPKEWEADQIAADFVVSELKTLGKTIDPRLAAALVAKVGSGLGFLSFEIKKISTLADADGITEIDAVRIKGSIAPLAETAIQPIVAALARRDVKALAGHLDRLKNTCKDDQTIRLCRILFDGASKWLAVAEFRDRGVGQDESAAEMGVNPWFWKNKVVPQAGHWTRQEAARLIIKLGDAERAVLSGQINPWAKLVAGLLESCR